MVAWFAVSNHCALGMLRGNAMSPTAHAHCLGHQTPAKQQNGNDMPCCKTLKATVIAKINVVGNATDFVLKEYIPAIFVKEMARTPTQILALDTGPPGAFSFSELVLQRSILAHAPPTSLS
jgi:hypothetical protein